jgi:hypothetical protein
MHSALPTTAVTLTSIPSLLLSHFIKKCQSHLLTCQRGPPGGLVPPTALPFPSTVQARHPRVVLGVPKAGTFSALSRELKPSVLSSPGKASLGSIPDLQPHSWVLALPGWVFTLLGVLGSARVVPTYSPQRPCRRGGAIEVKAGWLDPPPASW